MTNPFLKYLDSLTLAVAKGGGRISEVAGKRGEALIKRRVFNDGRASDMTSIGKYSDAYKAVREAKGRQTQYVDLQFTGELFRSIELGRSGNSQVLGITNLNRAIVAGKLELKYRKPIFALNDMEANEMTKDAARELGAIITEWANANP